MLKILARSRVCWISLSNVYETDGIYELTKNEGVVVNSLSDFRPYQIQGFDQFHFNIQVYNTPLLSTSVQIIPRTAALILASP